MTTWTQPALPLDDDDPIATLRAALAEDERVALAVAALAPGRYRAGSPEITEALSRFGSHGRALRWVAAAREILDRHRPVGRVQTSCAWCLDEIEWPCPDVRALASVYEGEAS